MAPDKQTSFPKSALPPANSDLLVFFEKNWMEGGDFIVIPRGTGLTKRIYWLLCQIANRE